MHCEQVVWLDSYVPAAHAVHVVFAASTIQPPSQDVQDTTVPVVENVPAAHALFVVAPLTVDWCGKPKVYAGHSNPSGHAVHDALVAVPASS